MREAIQDHQRPSEAIRPDPKIGALMRRDEVRLTDRLERRPRVMATHAHMESIEVDVDRRLMPLAEPIGRRRLRARRRRLRHWRAVLARDRELVQRDVVYRHQAGR